jgi:hypothetical protein
LRKPQHHRPQSPFPHATRPVASGCCACRLPFFLRIINQSTIASTNTTISFAAFFRQTPQPPKTIQPMASVSEPLRRSPFVNESRSFRPPTTRTLPILSSSSANANRSGDKMDVSQPQVAPMGPPQSSPNGERHSEQHQAEHQGQNGQNGASSQLVGAAAAAQQPKVVQTAFIHKLYKFVLSLITRNAAMADRSTVCWRISLSSTSSHGRAATRASSCRHLLNSQKFLRRYRRCKLCPRPLLTASDNTLSIPIFLLSYDSSTCMAFTKVGHSWISYV